MTNFKQKIWPINQLLLLLVGLSGVFTVLKIASDLFIPFLISVSFAIILSPLFSYLETKRIPKIASLLVLNLIVIMPIIILAGYIGSDVHDFIHNYGVMKEEFNTGLQKISSFFNTLGFDISQADISKLLSSTNAKDLVQNLALQAEKQFSNIFLIFFMVAFILMESTYLYNKLLKIMEDREGNISEGMLIIEKIQTYFLIKMKTSLVTGLLIFLVLWFYGISYALLWATLAFFLNFIPTIGSILAAIPAVLIGVIDISLVTGGSIALWYIFINTIIGNILEPRIMGKGLGLSALTIFISMTFWGWIIGPTGMILSVPLTMGMQYLFEQYDETKWLAFMLSDYESENENKNKNKNKHNVIKKC